MTLSLAGSDLQRSSTALDIDTAIIAYIQFKIKGSKYSDLKINYQSSNLSLDRKAAQNEKRSLN
jgi:hypothetical protein